MFENLIESKRKRQSSLLQGTLSLAIHGLVAVGAVKATASAVESVKEVTVDTTMIFLKPPEPQTPPPPPPEQVVVSANPPPQGFQVVLPPENIPTEIPPVNLNEKFDPRDFTGKGVEGGVASGVVGGTGPVIDGEVFLAAEVDEVPSDASPACAPKYPAILSSAGIPGSVTMQFIVNVDGHVDQSTLKVVSSSNKAFEQPAKDALLGSGCTFKPGKSRGQPVRVLVSQKVTFKPPT